MGSTHNNTTLPGDTPQDCTPACQPWLNILEKMYDSSIIIPVGVMGPDSNYHRPNENINLKYTKSFVCSMSHILCLIGSK